ncbi:unnamed protein product [Discula destructiva]
MDSHKSTNPAQATEYAHQHHHQPDGAEPVPSDIMPPLEGDDDDDDDDDDDEQQQITAEPAEIPSGDIFLLLNLPPNSTIGCDAKAIGTGSSTPFPGLRDLPPGGAHFLWVSAPDAMSRCGYWFITTTKPRSPPPPPPGQSQQGAVVVRVKQWDAFHEGLVDPPPSVCDRLRADAASLYPRLVPCGFGGVSTAVAADRASRLRARAAAVKEGEGKEEEEEEEEEEEDDDAQKLWRQLTACVDEKVLARVTGRGVGTGEWLVDTSDGAVGDMAGGFLQQQQQQRPTTTTTTTAQALTDESSGELHFLFPEDDVDVHTAMGVVDTIPDTSMDIVRLVDTPGTGITERDILGELQFAFLTGLHLSNFACIEQWWHLILKVVLRAHKLVLLRPRLSQALLSTFRAQLVYNETYVVSSARPSAGDIGDARNEYGGPGDSGGATSLLDVMPGNKRSLGKALTLYGRRMKQLLGDVTGGQVTPEQAEVGKAFAEVEEWFWKLGWDLRTEHGKSKRGGEAGEEDEIGDDDEDEYKPVIVNLDGDGREVGLVSFD